MIGRAQLAGGLLFLLAAAAAPVLPDWVVSLATIAFANALVVLGLGGAVARRARFVRTGALLLHRRLCGRACRALDRLHRCLCAGADRRRRCRAGGGVDRISAGALSRNLLRHAQPRAVDDPLWRIGEIRIAWARPMASAWRRRPSSATRRIATRLGCRCIGSRSASTPSAPCWSPAISARSPAALAAPIRDNEIRVEFLGVSVTGIIHTKVVIAGILGGARRRAGGARNWPCRS